MPKSTRRAGTRENKQRQFIFGDTPDFTPVKREDIYDAHHIFHQLEKIVDYLKNFDRYEDVNFDGGVLFHGPRGTGKTLMARWLASASGARFIDAREFPVELKIGVHIWQPRDIKNLFRFCGQWSVKNCKPVVLFLDQFDDFIKIHSNIVSQLEIELDGFTGRPKGVFLVGTSQDKPDEFGGSLFRRGRIGLHIAFNLPGRHQQVELLEGFLIKHPHQKDIDTKNLVYLLKEPSAAMIKFNVEEAYLSAKQEFALAKAKVEASDRKFAEHPEPPITEHHLIEVFLSQVLDPPSGHILSPEDQEHTRLHELAHYVVSRAWGLAARYVSVRPGLKSLGATDINNDSSRHAPREEMMLMIAAALASMEMEKFFDFSPTVNTEDDLDNANIIAADLVSEVGYRKALVKKYGLVGIYRDSGNTSQKAMSDLEQKELRPLLEKARKKAKEALKFFGKELLLKVSDVLATKTNGVMLQKELDALLEPKLSKFHRMHKITDRIGQIV